jgi:hypothetical protein
LAPTSGTLCPLALQCPLLLPESSVIVRGWFAVANFISVNTVPQLLATVEDQLVSLSYIVTICLHMHSVKKNLF